MIIAILVILGLCFGSFVNAYVWRTYKSKKSGKLNNLSVWRGRSICPSCHHVLAGKDLIPVFSWLALGGRCRYCKKPISLQYPVVELIAAVLFVLSYIYWPHTFNREGITLFVIWLLFVLGFVILAVYDLRWRLLPNRIVAPLIALAILQILVKLIFFGGGFSLLVGSFWGLLFSAGLFYGLFIVSKGTWIGGGDVKLAVVLGLLLGGPAEAILMVFLASLIGCVVSVVLILGKRLKLNSRIAFGPLLLAATIICYLFGIHIIDWYKSFII